MRRTLERVDGVQRVDSQNREGKSVHVIQVDAASDIRNRLAAAVIDGGHGLLELTEEEPSLEEVFLRITSPAADSEPI